MSAKPYFDEEVEAARAHLATVSQLDAKSGDTIAVCRDIERRWLATVDALKARLAAAEAAAATAKVAAGLMRDRAEKAEARAEVAVALLVDAKEYVEHCGAEGLLDRIAALLKEVPHGQQG